MAATTSSVQILKETETKVSFKIVGATGPESSATLIDASTLTGATGLSNLLAITQLDWNVNDTGMITLAWAGASGIDMAKLSRNGSFQLKRLNNVKLENNAGTPTGDILVTSTTGNYTLLIEAEKVGSGWTKIGQYTLTQ